MKQEIKKLYIENNILHFETKDGEVFVPCYDYTGMGAVSDCVWVEKLVDMTPPTQG